MLTITGKASHCTVQMVPPTLLVIDCMYAIEERIVSDSGEEIVDRDIVYIGSGTKSAKTIRFLKTQRVKTLSELPGVYFYGPIGIEPCE